MVNTVAAGADGSPSGRPPLAKTIRQEIASGWPDLTLTGSVRTIPGGGTIYAQEDEARFVYQVEAGVVRTVTPRPDGRRVIHEFHIEGEIFGLELGPLHHCSAEAIGETRVVQCPRARVEQLASDDEATARALRFRLLHERNQSAERSACLMYGTAFERLAYFLLDMASRVPGREPFELSMSRYDIADHLGLSSETVSRTFSVFRKHGLIATRGRLVTLLDDRIRPPRAGAGWPSDVRRMPSYAVGLPLAGLRGRWSETGDRDHG
jgi:CRP-like cAMP-binding protein